MWPIAKSENKIVNESRLLAIKHLVTRPKQNGLLNVTSTWDLVFARNTARVLRLRPPAIPPSLALLR